MMMIIEHASLQENLNINLLFIQVKILCEGSLS